jgi:hypothetical protein
MGGARILLCVLRYGLLEVVFVGFWNPHLSLYAMYLSDLKGLPL